MGVLDTPAISAAQARAAQSDLLLLAHAASADRAASSASSLADWANGTNFTDSFTNLTNWAYTAGAIQVSNGGLYAQTPSGGNSGANHAWPLGATGIGMATIVHTNQSGGTGQVIVGVSKDAAGATPAAGAANARGISIQCGAAARTWDQGAAGADSPNAHPNGVYVTTIVIDETDISVVTRGPNGLEWRGQWARSGFSVNNVFVFNSDSSGLSGFHIDYVAAKTTLTTESPRRALSSPRIVRTAVGNNDIRIALPQNYDSRRPSPVVMCFHGNGSDKDHFGTTVDNANGGAVGTAFVNAGYIVVSASYSPNTSTWGSDNGLGAYVAAYRYARRYFNLGPVVFYANSMGGIESLLTLAARRIPGVVGWIGTSPTVSLAANYASATFTSTINSAYGINGTAPTDYATLAAGHDPLLMAGSVFRSIPMWAIVATDDTTVLPTQNWNAFEPIVTPYCPNYTRTNITGGHSSASIAAMAGQFVAWADDRTSGYAGSLSA